MNNADRTGKVKWFNDAKGFGFITSDDGQDVFVHYKDIVSDGDYRTLDDGAAVIFETTDEGRGPRAINVRLAS